MTIDDVRELALSLPRSYEALVRDRVRFRVGQIVYLAWCCCFGWLLGECLLACLGPGGHCIDELCR